MTDSVTTSSEVRQPRSDNGTTARVHTEVREVLATSKQSSLQKYSRLCVGRPGLGALINYELRASMLAPVPGALGLVLRQKLLRGLFKRCGRGVVIGRHVTIRHPHRIALGDNVIIDDHCVLDGKGEAETTIEIGSGTILGRNSVLSCKGGVIKVAERVNISVNCTLISETQLSIGSNTLMAGHCYVIAGGNHGTARTDIPILEQPCIQRGGVSIGENTWLGAGATVLDGVSIGRDSIIGAASMVNRSVPSYTIAAGVPAKILRDRREVEETWKND